MVQYDDCYIELLELFPCNSKMELEKREGELMRLHLSKIVNKHIEGRTKAEHKAFQKASQNAYQSTPEYKAHRKEYQSTPEYKASHKASQKAYQSTPEYKAHRKEYQSTPEYKACRKEYREKRKQAKLINVNNATSIIPVNNISSNINIQESIIIPTTSTIPDIDSLIIDIE